MPLVNLDSFKDRRDVEKSKSLTIEPIKSDITRFRDIHLDFNLQPVIAESGDASLTFDDIEIDTDLAAISNSIVNLFTTTPGDKILSPEYGSDLRRYIHEPLSRAYFIGVYILEQLEKYEPRVSVNGVKCTPNYDENEYIIKLDINIPNISQSFNIGGRLSRLQGYISS